jgi:glutamate-ammonia-ligase adenylyltransferase
VTEAIEAALRRPRPDVDVAAEVRAMRDLMERERKASGFWDLKLAPGGQVDAEFVGQFRQLQAAAGGGKLTVRTLEQLAGEPALAEAWRLQQGIGQLLAVAYDERPEPEAESATFRLRLAEAVGELDFEALVERLKRARREAREAFDKALPPGTGGV